MNTLSASATLSKRRILASNGTLREKFLNHSSSLGWGILAVSLLITLAAWYVANQSVTATAQQRFDTTVEESRQKILARLRHYELALESTAALFEVLGRKPSQEEWQTFVAGLDISRDFPGIQGIGYAEMLTPDQKLVLEQSMRQNGYPDFRITPYGHRPQYSAIIYLEPFDWRNQRAFGYDMYSDSVRRVAMERARDSASLQYTGRVTLVQETEANTQSGFLLYLPIYQNGGQPTSLQQRRESLVGFVYSPFRVNDLLEGILGSELPLVKFKLFQSDGLPQHNKFQVYDSDPNVALGDSRWQRDITIEHSGLEWQLAFGSTPTFDKGVHSDYPMVIACVGVIFDIALFLLISYLAVERRRIRRLAANYESALEGSALRLNTTCHVHSSGLIEFQQDHDTVRLSEIARQLLRFSPSDTETLQTLLLKIAGKHRAEFTKRLQRLLSDEAERSENALIKITTEPHNGASSQLEITLTRLLDPATNTPLVLGVLRDISSSNTTLKTSGIAYTALEQCTDGFMVTDANKVIIHINPAMCRITGYSSGELIGQTPALLKSGQQGPDFYRNMWCDIHRHGVWQGQLWNKTKEGNLIVCFQSISRITNSDGEITHYVSIINDITEFVQQQRKLEHLATIDPLTNLPNRASLHDEILGSIALAHSKDRLVAICYLDLDGFKPINDRLGIGAGDELLVEVANRLQSLVCSEDVIARIGGDEFVIILNNVADIIDIEQAAKKIIEGVTGTYSIYDNNRVYVSASMGIAIYPVDQSDADGLLRHADQAMYEAKNKGRGRYEIFDVKTSLKNHSTKREIERIEMAIRDDEFCLFYQPKVDMRSGQIIGAEALIRWNHPEKGILPPAAFLPYVEGTPLARDMDRWVLNRALFQMQEWHTRGLEIPLSVNVDGSYLQHPDFVTELKQLLDKYPLIPAESLELELLESTALDNLEQVREVIEQCREMGVSVALDDFGTGYSSLTYLKTLPADSLKIDKSFIIDLPVESNTRALVEGIIGLANAFDRRVIAEGVESENHGLILMKLGCKFGQGYGIARPMPADQLIKWINAYQQPDTWHQEAKNVFWLNENRKKNSESNSAG